MASKVLNIIRQHMPDRMKSVGLPALAKLENIITGTDESARSQRMALVVFIIRVFSAVIAFASQVLLARWMGTFEYGIFVAIWTAIIIIDSILSLGTPSASLRFVSKYMEEKNFGLLWGVVIGSIVLGFLSAAVFTSLAVTAFYFNPQLLGPEYSDPAYIALFCLPILVMAGVGEAVSRAYNWVSVSFLPAFIYRPLIILALVFTAVSIGYEASAITAAFAVLLACHVIGITQLATILGKLRKVVPSTKPQFKPKFWLAVTLPVFLVESFYVLLTSVDVVFVGWLATPEETAVYFAATKILALVHFVYFAVRSAAAHRYSAIHASGNSDALADYVRQSISWTFWPSLFIGVLMILTGKYFLMLFGEEYVSGATILGILVAGIVLRSSVGPAESLLVMTGNQNACAAIYVGALFVNVTLNLSLIPLYGLWGAAIATAAAMAVESMALYIAIKRTLGIHAFILSKSAESKPSGGIA